MRAFVLSVKGKVAATSVVLLATTLAVVMGVVVTKTGNAAEHSADQLTRGTAADAATSLQAELETAYGTARDLRSTLVGLRATEATRAQADAVQRTLLEAHPQLLGVWTGWEPDAWDGADRTHVDQGSSDGTGRYVPYWFRDGDKISLTPLADYTKAGIGDYYLLPMTTGKEKVIDPYTYEVAGKQVLMTSLTVPVERDGRRVGVAGVDIPLDELQAQVARVRVYGTGTATLLSSAGTVVAGPDPAAVGKPAPRALQDLARASAGGTTSTHVSSAAGELVRVAAPLPLGQQDTWTLVVDVPRSVALADAHSLRNVLLLVALLALLLAAGVAFLAARHLLRPVDVLRARLVEISEGDGDLTQRVDESAQDEIGALGRAFNRFVDKVATTVREIAGTAQELGTSASALQEVAGRLAMSTQATTGGTARLAASSNQVDAGVQAVAVATEEMGATARDIAGSATAASRLAAESVEAAADASRTISDLGTSSAQIGDVVRVITGIAEQTNLLALNATIEAARAGDTGKGFAVVAGEVKELARETALATEDIATRIASLQADATRAGEALVRIAASIGAVDETQAAIATAVEEQSATVQSLARTVSEAAGGTADITSGIADVDGLAARTADAAGDTATAAADLDRLSDRLARLVGDFRC